MEKLIETCPISQQIIVKVADQLIRRFELKGILGPTFSSFATHTFQQLQLYAQSILQVTGEQHPCDGVLKTLHHQMLRVGRFLVKLVQQVAAQAQLESKKKERVGDGCCVWCSENIEAKTIESVHRDLKLMHTFSTAYALEEKTAVVQPKVYETSEEEMMKEIEKMQRNLNERRVVLLRTMQQLEDLKGSLAWQSKRGERQGREMPFFHHEEFTMEMGKHYYNQIRRVEERLSKFKVLVPKLADRACQTHFKTDEKDSKIEQLEDELLRLKAAKGRVDEHMNHWKVKSTELDAKVSTLTKQLREMEEKLLCETMLKEKLQRSQMVQPASSPIPSPKHKPQTRQRNENLSRNSMEQQEDEQEYDPIVLDVSQQVIDRLNRRVSLPPKFKEYHSAIRQSINQTLKNTFDTIYNNMDSHQRRFTTDSVSRFVDSSRMKNKQARARQKSQQDHETKEHNNYKNSNTEKTYPNSPKRSSKHNRLSSIRKTEHGSRDQRVPTSNFSRLRRQNTQQGQLGIESQFSLKVNPADDTNKKYKKSMMRTDSISRIGDMKENRKHLRTSTSGFGLGELAKGQLRIGHKLSELARPSDFKRISKFGHFRNRSQEDIEGERGDAKKSSLIINQLVPRRMSDDVLQAFLTPQGDCDSDDKKRSFWNYRMEKGKKVEKVVLKVEEIPFVTNCMALLAKAHLLNPLLYEQVRSGLLGQLPEIPSEKQKVLLQESVGLLVTGHRQCGSKPLCPHLLSFLQQLERAMSEQLSS